jgi:hypothetical protein
VVVRPPLAAGEGRGTKGRSRCVTWTRRPSPRDFSVGISQPEVHGDMTGKARGGIIRGGSVCEVSLVDRPSNGSCYFEIVKSAGGMVLRKGYPVNSKKARRVLIKNASAAAAKSARAEQRRDADVRARAAADFRHHHSYDPAAREALNIR